MAPPYKKSQFNANVFVDTWCRNFAVNLAQLLINTYEYDKEMPQSHTSDQPMALWGRDTTLSAIWRQEND